MSNFKKSKSEQFMEKRGSISQIDSSLSAPGIAKSSIHMSDGIPQVSALMAKSVSQFRRELLTDEVKQGMFRDGSGPSINEEGITSNSVVSSSIGVVKQAQVVSGGSNYRGGNGDVVKLYQIPIAMFANINGLIEVNNATYRITGDSGPAFLKTAGQGGAGQIIGRA